MQSPQIQNTPISVNPAVKKAKTFPAVMLMQLRRAANNGVLTTSAPDAIIRVAANLIAGVAAGERRTPRILDVLKFADRYQIAIDGPAIERIALDEFARDWITSEGIAKLLRITAEDQECHNLYALGVHGETYQDQKARTAKRQAHRKVEKATERAIARGPFHVNITQTARDFGLSRPTVYKLRTQWITAVNDLSFGGNFYTFVSSSINSTVNVLVCGKFWKISELMEYFNRSERTIQRWRQDGIIDTKMKARAGNKPKHSAASKSTKNIPITSPDTTFASAQAASAHQARSKPSVVSNIMITAYAAVAPRAAASPLHKKSPAVSDRGLKIQNSNNAVYNTLRLATIAVAVTPVSIERVLQNAASACEQYVTTAKRRASNG